MGSQTVSIEKLVYGGDGLARIEGQVVLVPYTLPEEEVAVTTSRRKGGVLQGEMVERLRSSEKRIVPACRYFARCGGCHYQQAEAAFQVEAKVAILRETLERLGGIRYEGEIVPWQGEPWHYRNRVQLHFKNGRMGFHRAGSHEIEPIDHCPISSPMLNQVLRVLAGAVKRAEWPKFLETLEIFTNEEQVQLNVVQSLKPVAKRFFEWCARLLPPTVDNAIDYRAAGHTYRISRGSFFQVNRFLTDALVEEALREKAGEKALDLYAGVGLFSLSLASRFRKVRAIERGAPAARDLQWNAAQVSDGIEAVHSSAEDYLRQLSTPPGFILLDPPRAGIGKEVAAELLRLAAPQLTIVSCDPTTLARDLKKLGERYRITRLSLADLFPQTYHFETIAHLELQ